MPAALSDQTEVDEIIGRLLRYGVITVCCRGGRRRGLVFDSVRNERRRVITSFAASPKYLRHMRGIVTGIPGFHCRRMIQLGLVLLIATPVARVAFSVVAFLLQRDRTYVVITLIVLAVLLFSLTGG